MVGPHGVCYSLALGRHWKRAFFSPGVAKLAARAGVPGRMGRVQGRACRIESKKRDMGFLSVVGLGGGLGAERQGRASQCKQPQRHVVSRACPRHKSAAAAWAGRSWVGNLRVQLSRGASPAAPWPRPGARGGWPAQSAVKCKSPWGMSSTTVEPSRKRPISSPRWRWMCCAW